jgi:hypothetical protein
MRNQLISKLAFFAFGFGGCLFGFQELEAQVLPPKKTLEMKTSSFSTGDGWMMLYEKARESRVVMSGENHSEVEANALMEYSFMRALYENCGYRDYIIELSPARAYYLQKYITEDDGYALQALQGISSPAYMKLFYSLHDWNMKLPVEDRIRIHGIDVERFQDLSALRMSDFLQKMEQKRGLPLVLAAKVYAFRNIVTRNFTNSLQEYQKEVLVDTGVTIEKDEESGGFSYSSNDFTSLITDDSLFSNSSVYKEWLKEDYSEFLIIKEGIDEVFKWNDLRRTAHQAHWRESKMYSRMKNLLDKYPEAKFFGQFGRCHISNVPSDVDCGWYNFNSVMNRLKSQDSTLKTVSIGIFYWDRSEKLYGEGAEDEIRKMKLAFSPGIVVYALNDKESQLNVLKSKYDFAVVNFERDSKLQKDLNEELESANEVEKATQSEWGVHLGLTGWGVLNMQMDQVSGWFNNEGRDFDVSPRQFFYHEIMATNGFWKFGFAGNYTLTEQGKNGRLNQSSDSSANFYYNNWNLLLQGGFEKKFGRFSFDLVGFSGYNENRLKMESQSKSILLLNNELKDAIVVDPGFLVGGAVGFNFYIDNMTSLGIRAQYQSDLSPTNWYYQGTKIPFDQTKTANRWNAWGVSVNYVQHIFD